MFVKEYMTRAPSVSPDDSARAVAEKMAETGEKRLLVTENGKGAGFVEAKTLTFEILGRGDGRDTPVSEFMVECDATTTPDATVKKAFNTMLKEGTKMLPVVDEGEIVALFDKGMVTKHYHGEVYEVLDELQRAAKRKKAG
ncbi:MAG: hypothetical protein MAG715_01037 [Methanonatronarchaeales archaeon]|nr:hypothetical protein [Methanonatronarchaeales archaeon]